MSGSTRRKFDIDYAILHKTGKKVPKVRESSMANQELQMQAIHIASDIEDLFESYQINNLNEIDQLVTFISKIEEIKRNFRRIHAQLRVSEGENYGGKYPDFDKQVNELTSNFKNANEKLKALRKIEKDNVNNAQNLRDKLEAEKLENEVQAMKTSERKFFIEQINWELENCNWENLESDEIKTAISNFEFRLEGFYKICSNMEALYGWESFKINFADENDQIISSIRKKINSGQTRIFNTKADKERLSQKKLEVEAEQVWLDETNRLVLKIFNLR